MLNTETFGGLLKEHGFNFYSGVPCSFLKYLINYAINDCEYVMAANEGDAVATCAGAYLGGKRSIVLFQNSGLTNATSPLISLTHIFRIPLLGIVSLRGETGLNDEPQHELMGQITTRLLDDMEIEWDYLSNDIEKTEKQIIKASDCVSSNKTFFLVVKKGSLDTVQLNDQDLIERKNIAYKGKINSDQLPARTDVLERLTIIHDKDVAFLATTGHTGRELY